MFLRRGSSIGCAARDRRNKQHGTGHRAAAYESRRDWPEIVSRGWPPAARRASPWVLRKIRFRHLKRLSAGLAVMIGTLSAAGSYQSTRAIAPISDRCISPAESQDGSKMQRPPAYADGLGGVVGGVSPPTSGGNLRRLLPVAGTLRLGGRLALGRRRLQRVGHELHIDAAVLRPPGGTVVLGDRIGLAQTKDINPVGRHVVLGRQILNDRISTAAAEFKVVVG